MTMRAVASFILFGNNRDDFKKNVNEKTDGMNRKICIDVETFAEFDKDVLSW